MFYSDHYRSECYEFSPRTQQWRQSAVRLEDRKGFPASVSHQQGVIMAGGRDFLAGEGGESWHYFSSVHLLANNRWSSLPDLPEPLADLCLVTTQLGGRTRLWAIGGSNVPQR